MTDVATQAWLDQEDRHVAGIIRRHGCFIQYVCGCTCGGCEEETSFAYSVGLFGLGHPELLILGVQQETAAGVINDLFARVREGGDLVPGELLTFEAWPHRIVPEHVPNPGQIVFAANRHYQRPDEVSVPVLQLTWDDKHGRFPWDDGYAVPLRVQPRPGAFRAQTRHATKEVVPDACGVGFGRHAFAAIGFPLKQPFWLAEAYHMGVDDRDWMRERSVLGGPGRPAPRRQAPLAFPRGSIATRARWWLNNTTLARRLNSGQLLSGWLGLLVWTFLVARFDDDALRLFDDAITTIAEWRGLTP